MVNQKLPFTWEHRIVREPDGRLILAEVDSKPDGKLLGYCEPFMYVDESEGMAGLCRLVKGLTEALNKPIIDSKEFR
jgi:hypothetical protein